MAKRKSANLEPAVMTITVSTPSVAAGATGTSFVDLSQLASIVNRRFYRQGLNWAVSGFKLVTGPGVTGTIYVKKIQNTWVASGAWEKAMRAWLKQQNDALANMSEPEPARFRDFKIFADEDHVTATYAGNLLPQDGALPVAGTFLPGEWEESQIVIPNDGAPGVVTEYTLHMHGANTASSKALIQGYANSRNTPHSPDPVAPGPLDNNFYNSMFDVGGDNDDVVNNATDKNDNLPYDRDDYPGEAANGGAMQIHDICQVTATTIGGLTYAKGGNFPCGLVRLDFFNTGSTSGNVGILIELMPGSHRGYLAEPMTEM